MRSLWYSSAIGSALLSSVFARPLAPTDGGSCEVVVVTEVLTGYPVTTASPDDETAYPTPTIVVDPTATTNPDDETIYPTPTIIVDPTETATPVEPTDIPTSEPTSEPGPEPTTTSAESSDVPTSNPTSTVPEPTSTPTPVPATCRPSWESTAKARSVGTLRAGLIFVDFTDSPADHFGQDPSQLYEPLKEQPADLYRQMSFGKLDFEIVPLLDKFYRMPNTSAAYGFADDEGLTAAEHGQYIADALAAVGDAFDFSSVDILFIAPPNGTEEINRSAAYSNPITAPSGREFPAGTIITFGNDLYPEGEWKTVNHETGHAMGLPDLYPYGPGGNGLWVGGFDMMGIVWGQSPDLFAWHKWRLNWIEENQVDCVTEAGTTTHRLSPIEVEGGVKAVAIPVNATGYVIAEVRSKQGLDHAACDSATGVLLYTADTALGSGDGPIRIIDTNPETSGCDTEANGSVLNDAPLREADATFDTQLGVKVKIVSQDGDDYVIEIEREA